MAIRRISELDALSIDVNNTLISNLLDDLPDNSGRKVWKTNYTFTPYTFETSEFIDEKDGSPSYYVSKQIHLIDLAELLTLEVKSDVNYILSGNTVFTGEKTFNGNISAFGSDNYISILNSDEISCYGNISAFSENGGNSYIKSLSCKNISCENFFSNGDLNIDGNISCSENIFCGGNISCDELYGVALSARWADLAEFYESDKDYEPGTLVKFGGEKEITLADTDVNAVITTAPGLVLNGGKQENKIMKGIALVGRVPVKIVGEIHKFDNITLSKQYPGYATRANLGDIVIGKALGTNLIPGYSLVECIVKLTF